MVALMANAAWHAFTAYLAYYRFKDAVENVSQFGGQQSEEALASRVLEIAEQHDLPMTAEAFTVRREGSHTIISGSFVKPVEILPGKFYPWPFSWRVNTFTLTAPASLLPAEQ